MQGSSYPRPHNNPEAFSGLGHIVKRLFGCDRTTVRYDVIGVFARKVHSLALGIVFGLAVGLLLAFFIARLQHGYYFQIMLPGGMVGLIVGYATQRYGRGTSQLQRS